VLALAASLAACSGQAVALPQAKPTPHATKLSLLQACRLLRADIIANGGTPDLPTLERVASQATDTTLATDATSAQSHVGKPDLIWIDLASFSYDCRPSGVQIPQQEPGS